MKKSTTSTKKKSAAQPMVNVRIPDDLHRRLKVVAAALGVPMGELASQYIDKCGAEEARTNERVRLLLEAKGA